MKREHFSGRTAAILALAGSAIGLGNLWRFPFMAGQNGGAAFVLIYLFCSIFLALPIFFAESVIGRRSQANNIGAMKVLAPGTAWRHVTLVTVVTPLVILSYYSVVGGWSVDFLLQSLTSGFGSGAENLFSSIIAKPFRPIVFHTLFLLLTAVIILGGVKSGIERFNKICLPVLFVLIVAIAIYSVSLPGARAGVRYLVRPDLSLVTPRTFAYAMGQAFFSLSLGVGTVLTYSSYIGKEQNIIVNGAGTAVFDLVFAIIAGLAIMPAVFAAGIEPGAGPGLIFETLPYIFASMGEAAPVFSRVVAVLFFLSVVIAALTSSISIFEVGEAYLSEEKGLSRRRAAVIVFVSTWLVGVLCSLSFGPLSDVSVAGLSIFGFCDALTSNFLMSFGALLFVIFVGWKMGRDEVRDEITNGGTLRFNTRIFPLLYFVIRWVEPIIIIAIFVTNLL